MKAVATETYRQKPKAEVRGSGYCVESLEAALWCFNQTTSFEEAVLEAVNLGDDADTSGAITGQLAGAHYGIQGIPNRWLTTLHDADYITSMATQLYDANSKRCSAA